MAPERRRWYRPWLVVTGIGLTAYVLAWLGVDWNPERVPEFLTVVMWWGWVPLLALPFFLTGKRQSFVIVVLIVACVPLSLVAGLAMVFGSTEKVVLSDAPAGQPALMVTSSDQFFGGSCIQVQRTTALGFTLQPLGRGYCSTNHDGDFLPFAARSVRFERFPERGLIAFVADATKGRGDGKLNLELFRISGPLILPVAVSDAADSAERDGAIRQLLRATPLP